jgi:hypothetical protein
MIITLYKTGQDGRLRYYTVHDRQPALDSPYALCSAWRIGMGREREKLHRFETRAKIRELVSRKLKEGYRLLYSFSRAGFTGESDIDLDTAFCASDSSFSRPGADRIRAAVEAAAAANSSVG